MSDIGHRHIGGNLSHRRWKSNRAPTPDAPKLQRLVYDVAVAASECNRTQHTLLAAVIKCRCMEAPLCGEGTSSRSIVGQPGVRVTLSVVTPAAQRYMKTTW